MEVNPIKLNVKTKEDFDLNVNGTNVNQKGALTIVPDDGIYLGTGDKSESILKIPEFHETNPNLLMNSDFSNFYRCAEGTKTYNFNQNTQIFVSDRWSMKSASYDFQGSIFLTSGGYSDSGDESKNIVRSSLKIKPDDGAAMTGFSFSQVLKNSNLGNGETLTFSGFINLNSSIQQPKKYITISLLAVSNNKIINAESKKIFLNISKSFEAEKIEANIKVPNYLYSQLGLNEVFLVFSINYLFDSSEENTSLTFEKFKLERGNVATPWCPYGGSYEADRNACLQYYEKVGAFAAGTEEAKNKVMFSLPFKVEKIEEPKLNIIKNNITWRVTGVNRLNTPISNLTEIKKTVNGCIIVVDDGSNGSAPNRSIFECNGDNFIEADAEPDFTQ